MRHKQTATLVATTLHIVSLRCFDRSSTLHFFLLAFMSGFKRTDSEVNFFLQILISRTLRSDVYSNSHNG